LPFDFKVRGNEESLNRFALKVIVLALVLKVVVDLLQLNVIKARFDLILGLGLIKVGSLTIS
jgi:hypothetical protein